MLGHIGRHLADGKNGCDALIGWCFLRWLGWIWLEGERGGFFFPLLIFFYIYICVTFGNAFGNAVVNICVTAL